jgi:hypothetical protein
MAGYQLSLDYRTRYTTTSITLANVDLITNSGKIEKKKKSNKRIVSFKALRSYNI